MATVDGDVRSAGVISEKRAMAEGKYRGLLLQDVLDSETYNIHCATVTPVGVGDYFFQLQNLSNDPIVVRYIEFTDATAEDVFGIVGGAYTGVAAGAAAFTAQNLYVGATSVYSTKSLVMCDVNLTGQLATEVERFRVTVAAATRYHIDMARRPVVLGTNQCLTLGCETGTGAITNLNVIYSHIMAANTDG